MPPQTAAFAVAGMTSLLQTLPAHQIIPRLTTRCTACAFSTTVAQQSSRKKRGKKRINDPYRAAQAQQRKSANITRQATLQQQRKAAMGDPIRSRTTPFIQTLSNSGTTVSSLLSSAAANDNAAAILPSSDQAVNFFLKPEDLSKQIAHSRWLTEPVPLAELNRVSSPQDPQQELKRRQNWEEGHENAARAVQNITSLAQGSSKDRTRLNIQRCIDEFGRHNTDQVLSPKPASLGLANQNRDASTVHLSDIERAASEELASIPKRVGPDTGSSEVQIAILTTKINLLADNLGKKDKHNKRNLRLLVHRRQKLLSYLRRRERGGPRWQHLVEKLGISDAMWKGEISL